MNKNNKLNPDFITGLTEAEGSFSICKLKDKRSKYGTYIGLRFKITMLTNETILITMVKNFFGCGNLQLGKNGTINFSICDIDSINKYVIPHFSNYPLRGTKYKDFLSFKEALYCINSKEHLTKNGLEKIIGLSYNMNSYREIDIDYSPLHTIRSNIKYIPINGHYINGFIAGDGCLYLSINNTNFGRMALQISQHKSNKMLLVSIANYFKSPDKIYYHDTDSLQITLSGHKLWRDIFVHFNIYPLYGTKLIKLNKLLAIRDLMLNNSHLIQVGKSRQ